MGDAYSVIDRLPPNKALSRTVIPVRFICK
jgi:hypothetical protein